MYRYSISTGRMLDGTLVEGWVMSSEKYSKQEFDQMVEQCIVRLGKKPEDNFTKDLVYLWKLRDLLVEDYGFEYPPEAVCNYYVDTREAKEVN